MLNVTVNREEGEWVATALEMDLQGYGTTIGEALTELADLVTMQVDFALFKGQPEMIFRPSREGRMTEAVEA